MRLISRVEARKKGLTRYFTGKLCKNGHVAEQYISTRGCVKCVASSTLRWQNAHPVQHLTNRRERRNRLKVKILNSLDKGACACCGETETVFLCVDHKKSNGTKHREQLGGQDKLYPWLIRRIKDIGIKAVRRDFRVLCWNCNAAYGLFGFCPHQRKK